ncbi:MAG: DUF4115 domain-containing protein [Candidatus Polarisedimenticolaceae bacterium]|nr:DUF4115 domain-containing protein [Candidatus Polarisedimenticolaceae bacterium]
MNATPTDEADIEAPPKEGAGACLRRAREALELSRAEAAAGLYLNESIVTALEEDDYDALPGPVFVQGYLRKYARLLNVPEGQLLKAYSHQMPARKQRKKPEGPLAGAPIRSEIHSSHTIVRLITWVIALGLLALVAVWWQGDMPWPGGQPDDEPSTAMQEGQFERPFALNDAYQSEAEVSESSFSEPADFETPQQADAESESETAVPDDAPMASMQDGSSADILPAQGLELDRVLGDTAGAASIAAAEPQPETLPADPAEPVAEPPVDYASNIVIEFSEACWIEIRGANNSYKLLGNMQKGTRHLLGGEPPYTFVLGNSNAVTLTIKGQVFDLKPHTKGNIARFVLQPEDIPNP